jgi:nucleoid-associated protein YgaU
VSRTTDRVVLLAWIVLVATAVLVLGEVAATFPPPPGHDLGALLRWCEVTPPLEAAASLLRLVAVGLTWYLLVATAIGLVGRAVGLRHLVRVADRVSPPALRRLLAGAVGAGLVAQLVLLSPTVAAAGEPAVMRALPEEPEPAGTTTMRTLPERPAPTTTMRTLPEAPAPTSTTTMQVLPPDPEPTSTTTMQVLPPDPEPTSTTTMRTLPEQPAPASTTTMHVLPPSGGQVEARSTATLRALPDEASPALAAPTWTVRPGDHLWHVAEVVLALDHGSAPPDVEVDAYVDLLVAANRDVLVHPDDPDLVLPGQVLHLPAP